MRVAIIGAGSSGIAACQVLQARGIDFDCYEVGSRGRRQLALPERQRHVVGVPVAAHQHVAPDHGVRVVPDERRVPDLSEPRADRALLRHASSTTSASVTASSSAPPSRPSRRAADGWDVTVRRRGADADDDAPLRRGARRQRSPLGRAAARAGVPRCGHVHRRAAALARLQGLRRIRGQARARARHRQLRVRHRGRDVEGQRADVPGDAPRCARRAEVPVRHPDRSPDDLAARAVAVPLDEAARPVGAAAAVARQDHEVRAAAARPPRARRAPDDQRRHPDPARPRRHRRQAEHRTPRRRQGVLHRRHVRGDRRRSSTAPATRSRSRSSTRPSSTPSTTRSSCSTASSIPTIPGSTSSASSSRSARSCRWPRRSRSGSPTCSTAPRRCRPERDAPRDRALPPRRAQALRAHRSGTPSRSTSSSTSPSSRRRAKPRAFDQLAS